MIKVDISQRLTMAQILTHPWMAAAQKCKYSFASTAPLSLNLPVQSDKTVAEMAQESARNAVVVEDGIISPFQPGGVSVSGRAQGIASLGLGMARGQSSDDLAGDAKMESARHVVRASSSRGTRPVGPKGGKQRGMNSINED
jgi:hypothetical protein